jgi:hypothetical protein
MAASSAPPQREERSIPRRKDRSRALKVMKFGGASVGDASHPDSGKTRHAVGGDKDLTSLIFACAAVPFRAKSAHAHLWNPAVVGSGQIGRGKILPCDRTLVHIHARLPSTCGIHEDPYATLVVSAHLACGWRSLRLLQL